MSRDVKYIGMDVHKEATVIAVQSGGGRLVMESIVETKTSSILQFIHGLRGELHVTWEEGTWAAWLYDLLQPQVQQVLVCDPRRNALLKEGRKSDKIRRPYTLRNKSTGKAWQAPCDQHVVNMSPAVSAEGLEKDPKSKDWPMQCRADLQSPSIN